ncbi:putative NAD dependent epimerase/dehydratase [Xylaria grammica]|nr:putative NAD dependent epimerase/dehydratase [Xylaria grammica]
MPAQQQQRIFITGAAGYIGSRVTEFALAAGYAVRGLARSEAGRAKLRALGAVPVAGTLASLDLLRAEAAQADIVMHLADAWIDDFSQPYDKVVRIDGAAVDAMAAGLAASGSSRKLFVGTSGIGVVAPDAAGGETDETAPENPNPFNGRIKCEKHILSKGGVDGVRTCIMRLPPFVYGRGGSGVWLFMSVFAKTGAVVRVGDGLGRTTVVHVDDAARAYVLAADRAPDRTQNIYNLSSSASVTFREFTDAIAATMGLPVLEMGAAEAAEKASPLIAGFLSDRVRGSGDKARRELSWNPREVSIVEDIRRGSYVQVAKELAAAAGSGA